MRVKWVPDGHSVSGYVLTLMATSLAFGLMLATVLVLILASTFYLVSRRLTDRAYQCEAVTQETSQEHVIA